MSLMRDFIASLWIASTIATVAAATVDFPLQVALVIYAASVAATGLWLIARHVVAMTDTPTTRPRSRRGDR